ncbi:hypothetical protein LTR78_003070 [Recurvomyces mirabilis]|uniref:Uncharacterized protein n=1 Tax=Recurvomyces mirabilis TaxID=574656 RepID=A0AAE1C3S0_9PEZI|nr:hypothetical protein LTR78_003070 [Recurvomyces mirabilis]KAK5157108.1 hypothetical protein LTS14_004626 [Recurvomyces mirabilis]
MLPISSCLASFALVTLATCAPLSGEQSLGPIPGQTPIYNDYRGIVAPFPGNISGATLPTARATELFNASSFTAAGYPNNTYDRIVEIRDNEAGHLNIFYREISNTSIKPGRCEYEYGFESQGVDFFLAEQTFVELSSISFLSGLVIQAVEDTSRAALLVVAAVETRHTAWALTNVWNTNPFAGPADTAYPWPNQILGLTVQFIQNGSCPKENPAYPYPSDQKAGLSFNGTFSTAHPGDKIQFEFPHGEPCFEEDKEYYAVFIHELNNVTQAFDTKTGVSEVSAAFDSNKGLIYAVIADKSGAPDLDSMLAGPLTLLQQPALLTTVIGGT